MSQYSNDFERKKLSWEGCLNFVEKYYSSTSFEGGGGSGQYITVYYIGGGGSERPQNVLRDICTAPKSICQIKIMMRCPSIELSAC